MSPDDDLEQVFRDESAQLLQDLDRLLLEMEEDPRPETREEAMRHLHTLKGMCNMAGHDAAATICHEAEDLLRAGGAAEVDRLLRMVDEVAVLLGQRQRDAHGRDAATIAVDVRKLDRLLNLAGELAVAETRLRYERATREGGPAEDTVARVSTLARGIQEEVMRTRLLPAKTLFAGLPRLARDVAREQGKRVRLDLDAGALELDRAVVDRMGGVLAHLVQNAIVHGIEAPDARAAAGKPADGLVRVRARNEDGLAVVEVEDDGRGIDPARVARRAVERGLLAPEDAEGVTFQRAADLLALPGFSTQDEAGRHAGRGVGLSAALEVARALGGALVVQRRHPAGTRVAVRLPPSVAVVDTLLAAVPGATIALTLRNVRRVLPAAQLRRVAGATAVIVEGNPVPVFSPRGEDAGADGHGHVVVAHGAHGTFGIAVDRVLGTHSGILKPIDAGTLEEDPRAVGATVLGNGTLALVLDPNAFQGAVIP